MTSELGSDQCHTGGPEAPTVPRKVFIVDDHPTLREGLARAIKRIPNLEICGNAASYKDALSGIEESLPDMVTMDISLPDKNGLEVIKELLSKQAGLRILVFSMHDEAVYAERAIRAGAKGYINKAAPKEELLSALHAVLHGDIYLSNAISDRLVKSITRKSSRTDKSVSDLTDRELEVFEMIGHGHSAAQIASRLNISSKTVDAHRANIKSKLAYPDMTSLIRAAVLWVDRKDLSFD